MLKNSKLMAFVATTDAAKAKSFYGGKLGLELVSEDGFAVVFNAHGTTLRVAIAKEITPARYTVLGWEVTDIEAAARDLQAAGIPLERYPFIQQDELAIWHAPGGARVAWFKDPEGNILSISQH
ncbi:MAG: VOC family protein [Acidobacteriaceae bacterium]|nr:VOC family protein [Acidobacteriaceae bacterium]